MRSLNFRYDSTAELLADEDLKRKGMAFDRLDSYLKNIIKDAGAEGVLAILDIKRRPAKSHELVYKLTEHFRRHLNSVYKDEIKNS